MTHRRDGGDMVGPLQQIRLPSHVRYIAIEGVIGAGKTTLCSLLQQRFGARLLLEQAEENPFLTRFYQSRSDFAFQTQLWFLVSRYRQMSEAFVQEDLFCPVTIADYMFAKDRIFAAINLDDNELALYNTLAGALARDCARPDFIVYLQVSTDMLMKRIQQRGRSFEFNMDRNYIDTLNQAYNHFFFHYTRCPVLIVNGTEIDFVKRNEDLDALARQIAQARPGANYYSPARL